MIPLKSIHRGVTVFVVLFLLYLGGTGVMIQLIDMRSLATHASPFDPNVRAMREAFDGPGTYQVIATSDYVAEPLPARADLPAMFARVMAGARRDLGEAPLKFVELRMVDGRAVGQVNLGTSLRRFDANTGVTLGAAPLPLDEDTPPISQRNVFKNLHRMTTFGNWALWINIAVSIALATLIVTGTIMYAKLVIGRTRIGRKGLFWVAGGWWRSLHRAVSILAAVFLVVVTVSGAWLAVESLGLAMNIAAMRSAHSSGGTPLGRLRRQDDGSAPLQDARLPAMLQTTLGAYRHAVPDGGLRVIRLRWYGGMPQGGVVTGEATARQLVYDAISGRRAYASAPGAPRSLFPFGWTTHQLAKSIHRGDYFGIPGRIMDLLAGLSMIYLSVSGIVMYVELWKRRAKSGRKQFLWS
ncbi:MAG: PepSY-associated TM helix domain-containing protein [Caulobacteraceae bacterium]